MSSPPCRCAGARPPSPVLCRQPASPAPAMRRPEHLPGRRLVVRRRAGLALRRREGRERRLPEDDEAVDLLHLVVRAEAERVDLALGRGIDPPALVAGEGALLVVGGDDVLAQLRADRLEQVAEVPDHGEVADDRVLPLAKVARDDARKRRSGDGAGADCPPSLKGGAHAVVLPGIRFGSTGPGPTDITGPRLAARATSR